jgi:hypothetical protein
MSTKSGQLQQLGNKENAEPFAGRRDSQRRINSGDFIPETITVTFAL